MAEVTRRGFLGLLSSAIAGAAVGVTLPSIAASPSSKLLHARHLYTRDISSEYWIHRIEVKFDDQQWGVDLRTDGLKLDEKRELEPALCVLNDRIGENGYEVGEIHTYSVEEWGTNKAAQERWGKIGDGRQFNG